MAIAIITEYRKIATDVNGNSIQAGQEPSIATQSVTFTTPKDAVAFHSNTRLVRIIADADAYVAFGLTGDTPSASAADTKIASGVEAYFGVPGSGVLSVYDGSS